MHYETTDSCILKRIDLANASPVRGAVGGTAPYKLPA